MRPIFDIVADGKNLTKAIGGKLMALSIVDEAGIRSDAATITLANTGPRIAPPNKGMGLEISLGYDHDPGLTRMGLFKVSEIELSGPPDLLTIRTTAAYMRESLKAPQTHSWANMTIGEIVEIIAARNDGYVARVSDQLASIVIPHIDQTSESDGHFLTRIANDYGAVFKPVEGKLAIKPRGDGKTISGDVPPLLVIDENDLTSWRYTSVNRSRFGAVTAYWRDLAANKDVQVKVGEEEPVFEIRNRFPDADQATAAARAKFEKLQRGKATLELSMPGLPQIRAETPLMVSVRHSEIANAPWVAERVEHRLGPRGYSMSINAVVKTR